MSGESFKKRDDWVKGELAETQNLALCQIICLLTFNSITRLCKYGSSKELNGFLKILGDLTLED